MNDTRPPFLLVSNEDSSSRVQPLRVLNKNKANNTLKCAECLQKNFNNRLFIIIFFNFNFDYTLTYYINFQGSNSKLNILHYSIPLYTTPHYTTQHHPIHTHTLLYSFCSAYSILLYSALFCPVCALFYSVLFNSVLFNSVLFYSLFSGSNTSLLSSHYFIPNVRSLIPLFLSLFIFLFGFPFPFRYPLPVTRYTRCNARGRHAHHPSEKS